MVNCPICGDYKKNQPPETTMNHEIPVSNSIDKDRNRHISTLYITVRDSPLFFLLFKKKKTKQNNSFQSNYIQDCKSLTKQVKKFKLTLFLIYYKIQIICNKLLPVRTDNSKIDFKIFTKEWDFYLT